MNEFTTPNPEPGADALDETVSRDTFGFTPRDLESLKKSGADAPKLLHAAYSLLELATEEPMYSAHGEKYGRFSFCSYSESAAQLRAAFQVLRRSLDFLEADFLACEAEQLDFLRGEVAKFEAMRPA